MAVFGMRQRVLDEVAMSTLTDYMAHREPEETGSEAAPSPIRVIVADDHELVAESLASALGDEPDILVAGVASTLAAVMDLVESTDPEVVILDYHLADEDGIEAAQRLRQAHPRVTIVLVTAVATESVLRRAMAAGCTGAATKDVSVQKLSGVIRSAAHGERAVVGDFESQFRLLSGGTSRRGTLLTAREQEVLHAVSLGHTTSAIARALGLSEYTVRNHVRNILGKLNAHTKLEAVIHAARAGLLNLDDE